MKTLKEVILEKSDKGYYTEVEGKSIFVYPNLYDFSKVSIDETFFEIKYNEEWIIKISIEGNEIQRLNENQILIKLSSEDDRYIESEGKKTTIPKNVDLSNAVFGDYFLVEIEKKKNFKGIEQYGKAFGKYDANKIVKYEIFSLEELKKETNYYNEFSSVLAEEFEERLFSVGLNYDSKKKGKPQKIDWRIPKDSYELLKNERNKSNFDLELNRLVEFTFQKDALKPFKYPDFVNKNNWEWDKKTFKFFCDKQYSIAQELCDLTNDKDELNLSIDWRLIVGLGNESVYETSITLHHIYGIPYIPASSVKGVIHHWAIDQLKEQTENKENPVNPEILSEKQIEDILGTEDKQGKIIFFDAFPCSKPTIEPDIMNPHYPDYYGGEEAPTDYQNPRPIFFLTVENTSFQFIIGIRKNEDSGLLETAKEWLKNALSEKGIGAKTAVGYGYMS